ncbi:MAG: hypothetical protein JNL70_26405 [Saprospiraceae bacterium]|nr:hypothetical protein [Saprospiraceae bacterium]
MIDVKSFVAVGGISGVQKLIAVRQNGLIIENFDTKQRKFVPVRQHEFSPFETISVYTDDNDTVPLALLLTNMRDQLADNPVPSEKADSAVLKAYFADILPNYDRDRVHVSDIKKAIKWFTFLNERNLLKDKVVEEAVEEIENTEGAVETAEN